ncbi:23226_t:CDS:2 [Gigaspora margarita]|uniref:23226_t:CDS:1 n=1 Tax=Gigaspora margarita TaxID=4874 RepID=A0ABN7VP42_GIGMA|nr:23226_t:CDS:2 [Gigaspora margarita]
MEKEKQVMSTTFRESFSGFINYEIESLSSSVLGSSMNYESTGSANYELSSPANYKISGPSNYGLSGSVGFTNLKLLGLMDLKLPNPMNLVLSGSTNLELFGLNSEITKFTNHLPGPRSSFNNWNEVQCAVDAYSKQHSFVAVKYYKDLDLVDKSIIRHHDYICWKSDMNKLKKVEDVCAYHNRVSDKIKSYTIDDQLGASQQYDLFAKEFPQHHIKKKNLYNVIEQDPEYVVISYLEGKSNELTDAKFYGLVKKSDIEVDSAIKNHYNIPQIQLREEYQLMKCKKFGRFLILQRL